MEVVGIEQRARRRTFGSTWNLGVMPTDRQWSGSVANSLVARATRFRPAARLTDW